MKALKVFLIVPRKLPTPNPLGGNLDGTLIKSGLPYGALPNPYEVGTLILMETRGARLMTPGYAHMLLQPRASRLKLMVLVAM